MFVRAQGDGSAITVEPGLIGGEINKLLAGHKKRHNHPIQYKIGPDPSSIDSCMVGGMVANNSSGMCCGVSQNTYHTLRDLRAVFADGSVLDTADPASCDAWVKVSAPGRAMRRVHSHVCGQYMYLTLRDLRTMFADGLMLDTADPASATPG